MGRITVSVVLGVEVVLACLLGAPDRAAATSFLVDLSPVATLALNPANYANGDHAVGLSALNAVGQPASPATGGEIGPGITYDDVSNQLSLSLGYGSDFGFVDLAGNFTVTHIHGPVAVQFPAPNTGAGVAVGLFHTPGSTARTGSIVGVVTLTATQESQLLDNLLYVNIHSGFAPGGEIRGQLVAVAPGPSTSLLLASKDDSLAVDLDGDGRADPGDTIRYSVVITNGGTSDGTGTLLTDTPDLNSPLVIGSVTTTQGTVMMGNTSGDGSVEVDVGTLAMGGGSATVTFDVLVDDPFPPGVLTVANQGQVLGDNFPTTVTDDPNTPAALDPTITEVANTALDICERELQECRDTPTFADADGDGEHDFTDHCADTPEGAQVDTAGCSVEQYCAQFDVSTGYGRASCNNADWRNNQPVGNPQNCKATQTECLPQPGACGIGFELAFLLPPLMWVRRRLRQCAALP